MIFRHVETRVEDGVAIGNNEVITHGEKKKKHQKWKITWTILLKWCSSNNHNKQMKLEWNNQMNLHWTLYDWSNKSLWKL